MKGKLVLFDFDGTITTKDTLIEFIKFYKGNIAFYFGFFLLSPVLILFKLKLIKNWKAKELMLEYFFKGITLNEFETKCKIFADTIIPNLLRPRAIEKLKTHIDNGDRVIIVSASAEYWIYPWSKKFNAELIGTQLEIINGKLTGKIKGTNCHGVEKVVRVKKLIKTEIIVKFMHMVIAAATRNYLNLLQIHTIDFSISNIKKYIL